MTDQNDYVIDLCSELIKINTANPPGNEKRAVDFCRQVLSGSGLETQIIQHAENRASLLAIMEGQPDGKTFLIVGHLDTVPVSDPSAWKIDPFCGYHDHEKIIGRGASDMKSGVAVMLAVAGLLARRKAKNTIIFAFTADEESDGEGAKALLSLDCVRRSGLVLIPEPTSNQIGVAEKGTLWPKITTKGKSAHGSMPDLGINAISNMVGLLNELDFSGFIKEEHPYLGTFTHSVNTIKGGIKTNIIPDRCEMTMDIRTLPDQDHDKVISTIQASIDGLAGQDHDFQCELETMVNKPGIEANLSEKYTAKIIEIIKKAKRDSRLIGLNYFTDGAVIVPELNIPFLIFGPGNSTYAHKDNEEVEISQLLLSFEIYKEITQFLAVD